MATGNEVLSWTSQDPRTSQLFGAYGVLYRFQVRTSRSPERARAALSAASVLTSLAPDGHEQPGPERDDAVASDSSEQRGPGRET